MNIIILMHKYFYQYTNTLFYFSSNGIAAATMRFDGTQHITLYGRSRVTEAEDLSFRFRTLEKDTLFVATRDNNSPDRLQITLGMFAAILK